MYKPYLIKPEAVEKLEQNGLLARIDEFMARYRKNIYSDYEKRAATFFYESEFVNDKDLRDEATTLKKEYYSHIKLSENDRKHFNKMILAPQSISWRVEKDGDSRSFSFSNRDAMVGLGYQASRFLRPIDFGNPEKCGFDHITDLFFAIGAQMYNTHALFLRQKNNCDCVDFVIDKKVYSYERNTYADFFLYEFEAGFDQAKTPFVTESSVAPTTDMNKRFISAGHSNEPYFLGMLVSYIVQKDIPSKIIDNPKQFLATQMNGRESMGDQFCHDHEVHNALTTDLSDRRIMKTSFAGNNYYVDEQDNFRIGGVTLPKEHIDTFVENLFVAAGHRMFRTSKNNLLDNFRWMYSAKGMNALEKTDLAPLYRQRLAGKLD